MVRPLGNPPGLYYATPYTYAPYGGSMHSYRYGGTTAYPRNVPPLWRTRPRPCCGTGGMLPYGSRYNRWSW